MYIDVYDDMCKGNKWGRKGFQNGIMFKEEMFLKAT